MPTQRLTHRGIAKLQAGRWMTDYWDDRLPGFAVRAHPSGIEDASQVKVMPLEEPVCPFVFVPVFVAPLPGGLEHCEAGPLSNTS